MLEINLTCSSIALESSVAWGYSIGASLILTILGALGIIVIIFHKWRDSTELEQLVGSSGAKPKVRFSKLERVLFGLGVGSMLGEVIFHIIPETVLPDAGEELDKQKSLWTLVLLIAGFFLFYLIESFFPHGHSVKGGGIQNKPIVWAYVIPLLLTDSLHNMVDGLAIGTAFQYWQEGLSLFLGIIFHEIGHELTNFQLLVTNGNMKPYQALGCNLVAASFSLVGTVIGRVFPHQWDKYILSFTGGGFIYISCVQVMPELLKASKADTALERLKLTLPGILSLVVGWIMLFLIAFYEDSINTWFC